MVKEKSDTSMVFSQYCWMAEVLDISLEYKQSGLKCVVISRVGLFVPQIWHFYVAKSISCLNQPVSLNHA